jgi:hypothetical protein
MSPLRAAQKQYSRKLKSAALLSEEAGNGKT